MINTVIKQTLNKTVVQLADLAKDIPKEVTKKIVCFTPRIIRHIRTKQARENRPRLKRRIKTLLGLAGALFD